MYIPTRPITHPGDKMEGRTFLHTSLKFWEKGGGLIVNSRGASGGIITLWDSSKFELVDNKSSSQWIFTWLLHKNSGVQFCLFNIYVFVFLFEKKACWDLLQEVSIGTYLYSSILARDLNVTVYQSEKRKGSVVQDPIREQVDELILDWDLTDIIPSKGKFT